MKLNPFNSGKPDKKNKPLKSNVASSQIADLEKQLSGWTDNLKQTEQRLKKLSDKTDAIDGVADTSDKAPALDDLDIAPVRPHGPMKELSLDSEESLNDGDTIEEGEETEVVKMVEPKPDPVTPAAPAAKHEKPGNLSDSFKQLFADDEEDENPLANLVKSLPEVTVDELEEDLKEIKDIIKDWQRK
jgi:hypothetical protein